MTDAELAQKCVENDSFAQKLLFERFSRKMMGLCLRYAERMEEAEDMLQNGFIRVFDKLHTFKGTGSLEGWIRKLMINESLAYIRKYKQVKTTVDMENAERLIPGSLHTGETAEAKDLLRMIQNLPAGFRTVFNLYAIEGYSHREIGELLGISEGTSKSQYARARMHLQNQLRQEPAEILKTA